MIQNKPVAVQPTAGLASRGNTSNDSGDKDENDNVPEELEESAETQLGQLLC